MKKYKDQDIDDAKELRKTEGYSFAELQNITGIPATTIRNWCKDDISGSRWDTLLLSNERKRQLLKSSEKSIVNELEHITQRQAKIYASLLYWCEGSKYPSENSIAFTNSDPTLTRLFIDLLRKSFLLDESKFRIHIQIHDTHDFNTIKQFWSELLSIPQKQILKPTITKANGGKHRKDYFGTCTIRYHDFRIQLKLIGIYEEFVRKFRDLL